MSGRTTRRLVHAASPPAASTPSFGAHNLAHWTTASARRPLLPPYSAAAPRFCPDDAPEVISAERPVASHINQGGQTDRGKDSELYKADCPIQLVVLQLDSAVLLDDVGRREPLSEMTAGASSGNFRGSAADAPRLPLLARERGRRLQHGKERWSGGETTSSTRQPRRTTMWQLDWEGLYGRIEERGLPRGPVRDPEQGRTGSGGSGIALRCARRGPPSQAFDRVLLDWLQQQLIVLHLAPTLLPFASRPAPCARRPPPPATALFVSPAAALPRRRPPRSSPLSG